MFNAGVNVRECVNSTYGKFVCGRVDFSVAFVRRLYVYALLDTCFITECDTSIHQINWAR